MTGLHKRLSLARRFAQRVYNTHVLALRSGVPAVLRASGVRALPSPVRRPAELAQPPRRARALPPQALEPTVFGAQPSQPFRLETEGERAALNDQYELDDPSADAAPVYDGQVAADDTAPAEGFEDATAPLESPVSTLYAANSNSTAPTANLPATPPAAALEGVLRAAPSSSSVAPVDLEADAVKRDPGLSAARLAAQAEQRPARDAANLEVTTPEAAEHATPAQPARNTQATGNPDRANAEPSPSLEGRPAVEMSVPTDAEPLPSLSSTSNRPRPETLEALARSLARTLATIEPVVEQPTESPPGLPQTPVTPASRAASPEIHPTLPQTGQARTEQETAVQDAPAQPSAQHDAPSRATAPDDTAARPVSVDATSVTAIIADAVLEQLSDQEAHADGLERGSPATSPVGSASLLEPSEPEADRFQTDAASLEATPPASEAVMAAQTETAPLEEPAQAVAQLEAAMLQSSVQSALEPAPESALPAANIPAALISPARALEVLRLQNPSTVEPEAQTVAVEPALDAVGAQSGRPAADSLAMGSSPEALRPDPETTLPLEPSALEENTPLPGVSVRQTRAVTADQTPLEATQAQNVTEPRAQTPERPDQVPPLNEQTLERVAVDEISPTTPSQIPEVIALDPTRLTNTVTTTETPADATSTPNVAMPSNPAPSGATPVRPALTSDTRGRTVEVYEAKPPRNMPPRPAPKPATPEPPPEPATPPTPPRSHVEALRALSATYGLELDLQEHAEGDVAVGDGSGLPAASSTAPATQRRSATDWARALQSTYNLPVTAAAPDQPVDSKPNDFVRSAVIDSNATDSSLVNSAASEEAGPLEATIPPATGPRSVRDWARALQTAYAPPEVTAPSEASAPPNPPRNATNIAPARSDPSKVNVSTPGDGGQTRETRTFIPPRAPSGERSSLSRAVTPAPQRNPVAPRNPTARSNPSLEPAAQPEADTSLEANLPAAEQPAPQRIELSGSARRFLQPLIGIDPADVPILTGEAVRDFTREQRADAAALEGAVLLPEATNLESPQTLGLVAHELVHVAAERQARRFVAPSGEGTSSSSARDGASVPVLGSSAAWGSEEERAQRAEARVARLARNAPLSEQPLSGPPSIADNPAAALEARWGGLPAPWQPLPAMPGFAPTPSAPPGVVSLVGAGFDTGAWGDAVTAGPPMGANALTSSTGFSATGPSGAPYAGTSGGSTASSSGYGAQFAQTERASASDEGGSKASGGEQDISALARQVYAVLKRRLQNERNRGGL